MENEIIRIGKFELKYYSANTLIIGSGAAALNAAVALHSMGQRDILLATSEWGGGTSNNAGSDKQTYYKLSLCGDEPDSVVSMARDLFNGRCMHGDIALCEAQGSVQAFMHLVELGVRFPKDKYGSWAGYKTDNDNRARATSAGPDTSKTMVSVLSEEVRKREIKVFDNHHVIELFTDKTKTFVVGALAINTNAGDPLKAFTLFNAVNIILGTGGPGDMYEESVYPFSQTGSIGMALRAGAMGQNLTESQFGIASTGFRWNLSGSFQQVIPRYFSTGKNSDVETEFLNDYFPDYRTLTKAIFLKGYEWPFDVSKVSGYGSSLIDLLIYREKEVKGRKVFLDFRRNPSCNGNDRFDFDELDPYIKKYLENSGAQGATPVERLRAINSPAFNVFLKNGYDLAKVPIEIGVCAQHNNGGLKGNIWWESDLKHLFPVGEVNGSHGVLRPGGSALNSGQVGSRRAAEFIIHSYGQDPPSKENFIDYVSDRVSEISAQASAWLTSGNEKLNSSSVSEIRKRMSGAGSIIRNRNKVAESVKDAKLLLGNLKSLTGATNVEELAECFRISDSCLAHWIYLEAIKYYIGNGGHSRGSCIIDRGKDILNEDLKEILNENDLCRYERDVEKSIIEIALNGSKLTIRQAEVREIPVQNLWFEKVWKDYIEDNFFGC